jgi:K+-transporting ATPase ATPase A chain
MSRWFEYAAFLGVVLVLAQPVGVYVARVFGRQPTFLDPVLRPVELVLLRTLGVDAEREMSAGVYIGSFVLFGTAGTLALFALLLVQSWLPGGPDPRYVTTPMTVDLAANVAWSFSTTTTWQAYSGETTLRYVVQVVGLASQNFLSGAAGLAAGIAFIRGFAREGAATLGNFWVDLCRGLLWLLLPVSFVGGLFLVWQGVPLNLSPYVEAHPLDGGIQILPQGPVAAIELIKNLGTNGGGFFNANGAHPYENPTPLTSFVSLLAMAVLPASLPVAFGHMTQRPRAGSVLLAVMVLLFAAGLVLTDHAEASTPARLIDLGVTGGNMEGKETRFGIGSSVLTAVVTSNTATGSYNSMHGSYQPLGVLVLLLNMLLGEVAFGGLGTGLYSMVMVALAGVFLAGLMVGRTPQYLGKTIGAPEARLVSLYALFVPLFVLPLTACAATSAAGRAGLTTNLGPRGFTEILFAYASCMANNGQTMAGLATSTVFYNLTTIPVMIAGRFGLAAVALTLAGRLAQKPRRPETVGTLPCDTLTFGALVLVAVAIIGALCYMPALAFGPIGEALSR